MSTFTAKVVIVDGGTMYGSLAHLVEGEDTLYFAPVGTPPPVDFDEIGYYDASSIVVAAPNPWVTQWQTTFHESGLDTPSRITYPKGLTR